MATITNVTDVPLTAEKHLYEGTIAFDSSYPTGGEALDGAGNRKYSSVWVVGGTAGYSFSWDAANQKLIAYYADNNNASDGPQIQVPDTTDVASALGAVKFCAIGA